ncbi:glycoside hydrolase family 172 protein [Aureliella helgolandensis]|nr:glycoside hydrolase family 172 protein [Aureliella helgolandensis]
MLDRDSLARFPKQDFRLKQASSYDRLSKTPDEPKGWFSNVDRSTSDKQKNFVRTEENNGRKEWVVMEDKGAGAITRVWVPWPNQLKPETDTVIRFYLDGASEPTIEGNMFELFQGKGLVPFPLAHESLRSAVSFFPIPYAKSCKITMSHHPFFFQFTYRDYNENVEVQTFSMDDFQAVESLIETTCQSLLHPAKSVRGEVVKRKQSVESGLDVSLPLPDGTASVRTLSLNLDNYDDPNITRQVILRMSFDEKETVWCPIGDFFGSGIGLNPFQGWYRTINANGTLTCRWVMPYQNNAMVSILNLSDKPVDVELSATVDDWKWDSSSMYFHAGWRGRYPVPTRPFSDWNYVKLKGRGVYVGDTLTVMNPVSRWWGEGDEKIYADGEAFPSIFGTGTEDYYAYSWGGRSTDFYEHPFHAQTFSHKYNKLNRKPKIDEKNTQGFSTETRTRGLDTIPFASSLQLDMEVWSWTDCDMGYGVGVYWYGDADTTSNHNPDPTEALNIPVVPIAENVSVSEPN